MRRLRFLLAGSTMVMGGVACGGTVQDGNAVTGGGAGAVPGGAQGGSSAVDGGFSGSGGSAATAEAGLTDARYLDPGCPPAMKIAGPRNCDVFSLTDCGPGSRCAPFVRYADKCQTEVVGTDCEPAGEGRQGDDCSTSDCAAGFVCVTAGTGFQCAGLCQLVGNGDTCPPGLLCSPLDVDDFFVCG